MQNSIILNAKFIICNLKFGILDLKFGILDRSCAGRMLYAVSLPMLLCFWLTVPDVRRPKLARWYPVTMAMAVVWLAFLAETMMDGADKVACLLAIPDDVMGLAVTAGGTSLPNLFASVIVAKQGLGNMAVSNAFGSNTFNIFVALALPWLVGTLSSPEGTYEVPKGRIFGSCLALGCVLVFFLVTVRFPTDFHCLPTVFRPFHG